MPCDSAQVPGDSPPPLRDIEPRCNPLNSVVHIRLQHEHHEINCAPAGAGTALEALHFIFLDLKDWQ